MALPVTSPPARPPSPEELHRRKLEDRGALQGRAVPSNVDWYRGLSEADQARVGARVLRRPSRTLSGVAVVAVMTAPAACPHGRCTYCPGGVEFRSPQSYTGEEPSALRGAQFAYDPRAITSHRLEALESMGHPTSKVEVIVMGGTFPSRPRAYRESVFRGVFDGLNGGPSSSLEEAQLRNETAPRRCVGMTVETRPDWCDGRILPEMLASGVTRVELGVECLRDDVLLAVGRAHGVEEVVRATREARDRGLKVCYHLMLGLPGMDPTKDLEDFRRLFDDPAFRPDMLKIYPTLVLPGTGLYDDWRAGRYEPYDLETAATLLAEEKALIPPWVRVQRVQRDIPSRLISAGVRTSNIREEAVRRLASGGRRCRCLRCREPGRRAAPAPEAFLPVEHRYEAAGGSELFLSFEDPVEDVVAGFLRLRFPSDGTDGGARHPVIRELKVLGSEVAVGTTAHGAVEYQHHGFGRALVARAEEAARSAGATRLHVLSAVGTREYYRRLGFERDGPLMTKSAFA